MTKLLIKICGITHRQDAILAANLGADLVGIILSPRSPRCVDIATAKDLASAIREHGARSVGLFVDEGFEQMCSLMEQTGIEMVQVHGDGSRAAVNEIAKRYETILALPFDYCEPIPPNVRILYDNSNPGSGKTFAWNSPFIEKTKNTKEWILAGGLNANNIEEALRVLKPTGVDVMGGVADTDSDRLRRKDPAKMEKFIALARGYRHE